MEINIWYYIWSSFIFLFLFRKCLPCDRSSDWLSLHDSFLFSLSEERDLVVDILQHDEDRGLAGQLLGSVVLKCSWRL